MTPAEQLKESVLSLQAALLDGHPQMPTLLQQIHRKLKEDPTIVTILDEDDIGIIVAGLSKQTQTTIATSLSKSKAKTIKSIGIGDL
jgi:hypothetical protein